MIDINTEEISKSLNKYAEGLKIKDNIYKKIRTRREEIFEFIKLFIKEQDNIKLTDDFNLGSYIIKTGVMYHNNDFDIDYAIVLNVENTQQFINKAHTFMENMCSFLSKKLKDRWKKFRAIVRNKKNVIAIKFLDQEDKQIFHLDLPFYLCEENKLYLIRRIDERSKEYTKILSEPKITNIRQREELDESKGQNSKRNAIILLKHLRLKKYIKGISSIYITDKIISFSRDYDTYILIKEFFEKAISEFKFYLNEEEKTN